MSNPIPTNAAQMLNEQAVKKAIGFHKKAVTYLERAKEEHNNAIRFHEMNRPERARQCTVVAQRHMRLAREAHKAIVRRQEKPKP
jgi:hypothetical protein